jgi:hypothetical protein
MKLQPCGCKEGELSFTCALRLADAAQAQGDSLAAERYIELAYAAADRGITAPVPNFALHEVYDPVLPAVASMVLLEAARQATA